MDNRARRNGESETLVGMIAAAWVEQAREQHGVISRRQLTAHGIGETQCSRMCRAGELHRVHRGVHLVRGAPLTHQARLWAAVLATDGFIGFGTAARLWATTDLDSPLIHVVVPHERHITVPRGVRTHRVPLPPNAHREMEGLPVSSRPWSVLDHLSQLRGSGAGTYFDRAIQQGWLTADDVYNRLRDWRGRIGNTQLRRLASTLGDNAAAESERRLHRLLRDAGIAGWIANHAVPLGDTVIEVDVAFPRHRVAIEVDGMAFHVDAARFRGDRTRQNRLVLHGWTVLRFTWVDLTERPSYVLSAIREALATRKSG